MNFQRIMYFLDVAELKSFTRAAEKNSVSQTAVSQQIALVEKELGFPLFIRRRGAIQLTSAGEFMYQSCKRLMGEYSEAVLKAERIHRMLLDYKDLAAGYTFVNTIEWIYDAEKAYNQREKDRVLSFKPVRGSFSHIRNELKNGRLDLAIGPYYVFEGLDEAESFDVHEERLGLFISVDNPLSKRNSITVDEINDLPYIVVSKKFCGEAYGNFMEKQRSYGTKPEQTTIAGSYEELITFINLNKGVSILPESMYYNSARCRMLRIEGKELSFRLALAVRKDMLNDELRSFIEVLKSTPVPRFVI